MEAVLHTLPLSHYGERARWALDHAGIDYHEVHHLQIFSWPVAYWLGGRKTLPVFISPEGRVINDSSEIVHYASANAPSRFAVTRDEDARLESKLARELGDAARQLVYAWFLREPMRTLKYNAGRAPGWQYLALRMSLGPAALFMKRYYALTPENLERAYDVVNRSFDEVAARLTDGRLFLTGDFFSSLDLTFSAMAAPMLLPPEYPSTLPAPFMLPGDIPERVRALREHPAGKHVMHCYVHRAAPRGRYDRPLRV